MTERCYPAFFMRGGTSKALMFRQDQLPARDRWDEVFCGAMGTPDAYGRQLNGMGGGLSSLSKVCIVGRSERPDADVDYTFAQVLIGEKRVDYKGNCGNMSAAVGPFAIETGLVDAQGDQAVVRIFNTNTEKVIRAVFPLKGGKVIYEGDLEIPGVSGSGAPIELQFLDPGGASTGRLLPSGAVTDTFTLGGRTLRGSMVDAANACVFLRSEDVSLKGTELPDDLEQDRDSLALMASIRTEASVRMGIAPTVKDAAKISSVPYIAFVSPPQDYHSLDGNLIEASSYDLSVRVISNGQPHRASPLTIALCTAVACQIGGTVPAELAARAGVGKPIRLGTPSGVLTLDAKVVQLPTGEWRAETGTFFRTARKLFQGEVWSRS